MSEQPRFSLEPADWRPTGSGEFDIRPRSVKEWLAGLPHANLELAAHEMLEILTEVNSIAYTPKERAGFLDIIHDSVTQLISNLRRHYTGMELPLPAKKRVAAHQVIEFQHQLAIGHYLIARHVVGEGLFGRSARKRRNHALFQANRYLSDYLLTLAQIYHPVPAGVWESIHDIYYLAEMDDLAGEKLPGEHIYGGQTAEGFYMAMQLFALCIPQQLQSADIPVAMELAFELSEQCQITNVCPENNAYALIHPDRDQAPGLQDIGGGTDENIQTAQRYLDFSGALVFIRELIDYQKTYSAADQGVTRQQHMQLQQRLLKLWETPPQRGAERNLQASEINTLVGLKAIHSLMETHRIKHEQEHALDDIPIEEMDMESVVLQSWGDGVYVAVRKGVGDELLEGETSEQSALRQLRAIDSSEEGYRLHYEGEKTLNAYIGEVIAVREDEHQSWKIGDVRWVESGAQGGLELGLHLFADHVIPGILYQGEGEEKAIRCLVTSPSRHRLGTLIMESDGIKPGEEAILRVGRNMSHVVHVERVLQSSHTFCQAEYRFR